MRYFIKLSKFSNTKAIFVFLYNSSLSISDKSIGLFILFQESPLGTS